MGLSRKDLFPLFFENPKDFVLNSVFPLVFRLQHEPIGAQSDRPPHRTHSTYKSSVKLFEGMRNKLLPCFGHQNSKFVSSQAAHDVHGAGIAFQSGSQELQEPISDLMAEVVV